MDGDDAGRTPAADGCVADRPLACGICGRILAVGDEVHCNDGYDRVYGEFVLGAVDGLHEDNWPAAHRVCAVAAGAPAGAAAVPRAVALRPGAGRRGRAVAAVALAIVGTSAAIAVSAGPAAAVAAAAIGTGLAVMAWGFAARRS
ncbi:MAG: hypothetical protein D6689_03155 [Deltaproteobacteria bacterium]|nr:MAG: hypothetical protein D6689_03155 [Deltaproteobacteria bacterium]